MVHYPGLGNAALKHRATYEVMISLSKMIPALEGHPVAFEL